MGLVGGAWENHITVNISLTENSQCTLSDSLYDTDNVFKLN